ncbi:alpha-2-macroglobulin receptor-associated protein [Protopterus annectens]|uniref:alpha-2-macroglobulin receptor-associated protein n=1 Tax=Protopterus annectens TaxID=7888 RepID=UPI001CF98191|nr:alpha-2-macroglobulin receptor-associated protein [Protopterus annectens]
MGSCGFEVTVVFCLYFGVFVLGSKYSKELNEPVKDSADEKTEFRISKLNQIWEKAHRLEFSAVKLSELHSDLKLQEKDELNWKKLKAEGLDEDGEKEAKLRRNLNVILARYEMDGKKDPKHLETNFLQDHDGMDSDVYNDPKLDKLWIKAKSSGKFSETELENLRREFKHHKEKLQEYQILMDTISRTEEFKEPRVIELWEMAQRSNFTTKELESLKEELQHFEVKVEKHQHYKEQLEISHQKLKHVEALGDKEHLSRNKEKHTMLSEKTKELGYKVKKFMQDLTNRISRGGLQHNEL